MSECIVGMKSRHLAERAMRAAAHERISAELVQIDPSVTRRGCSLGIKLCCEDIERLRGILDKKKIAYGDTVGRGER